MLWSYWEENMRGMMRLFAGALSVVATSGWAGLAVAQTPQQENWCEGKDSPTPDLRIGGCTAVIQSGNFAGKYLAWSFTGRGNAYSTKGQYDRAIADYDQAIRLNPSHGIAFYNRGYAWRAKGEYDRSIADYDQAIQLDPNFSAAFNNRGTAYDDKKDYDRAIADYDQAIRLDPNYARAFNNRGNAYAAKGAYTRAALDFDEVTRLQPTNANAWNHRCWARAIVGQLSQAILDCNESIRLNPTTKLAASLYGRGIAKRKSGDTVGGDADIAAAMAIQPDITEEFARYELPARAKAVGSIQAPRVPLALEPSAADCQLAETHWKSVEEIKTLAVYQDHLVRFPNCAFSMLATARMETLRKYVIDSLSAQ